MPAGMRRIHELFQLRAESFHLLVVQNTHALQVAIFAEEFELLFGEAVPLPVASRGGAGEQRADGLMVTGQVFDHARRSTLRLFDWQLFQFNLLDMTARAPDVVKSVGDFGVHPMEIAALYLVHD